MSKIHTYKPSASHSSPFGNQTVHSPRQPITSRTGLATEEGVSGWRSKRPISRAPGVILGHSHPQNGNGASAEASFTQATSVSANNGSSDTYHAAQGVHGGGVAKPFILPVNFGVEDLLREREKLIDEGKFVQPNDLEFIFSDVFYLTVGPAKNFGQCFALTRELLPEGKISFTQLMELTLIVNFSKVRHPVIAPELQQKVIGLCKTSMPTMFTLGLHPQINMLDLSPDAYDEAQDYMWNATSQIVGAVILSLNLNAPGRVIIPALEPPLFTSAELRPIPPNFLLS